MKKKDTQDERVLTQRRKIQSDAFDIIYFVLLVAVIVQQFLLDASFEHYAVELVCILVISVYLLIRNIAIGNNIFGEGKQSKAMPVVNSLVIGIMATVIFGILNYAKYSGHYENNIVFFIVILAVFFVSIALPAFVVISFFAYLNNRKQAKIQKQLDEDEQGE